MSEETPDPQDPFADMPAFFADLAAASMQANQEPSSDLRQAASALREIYIALSQVGFNDQQAMTLTVAMLHQSGGLR